MIVIIDDELIFAEKLKKELVQHYNEKEIVTMCEFDYEFLTQNDVDILFLDIELKKENGIDLAIKLRKKIGYNTDIVFVSSHDNLVYDSFTVAPSYFIRKDKLIDDLHDCVRILKEKNERKNAEIFVNKQALKITEILYLESKLNYVYYNTISGKVYRKREKLSLAEAGLIKYNFVRCHSSFLVNVEHIHNIENDHITLKNNINIPISRRRRDNVFRTYVNYRFR